MIKRTFFPSRNIIFKFKSDRIDFCPREGYKDGKALAKKSISIIFLRPLHWDSPQKKNNKSIVYVDINLSRKSFWEMRVFKECATRFFFNVTITLTQWCFYRCLFFSEYGFVDIVTILKYKVDHDHCILFILISLLLFCILQFRIYTIIWNTIIFFYILKFWFWTLSF